MSSSPEPHIDRVERSANHDWQLCAERGLRVIARQKQTFTSDDVWDWLKQLPDLPDTKDHRAMGAVFRNGYRDHLIVPINQWQASRRRIAHRRPVRVWKSLITM